MAKVVAKRRKGMSLLEGLMAMVLLVVVAVPVLSALRMTTRNVGISRDHLVAHGICERLYEYAAYYGTRDDTTSFLAVEKLLEVPDTERSVHNGCKGKAVSQIEDRLVKGLMPDDGKAGFRFDGSSPAFANLYRKFSYTLDIAPATCDRSAKGRDEGVSLYRMDIVVYWKGSDAKLRHYPYSTYLARRRY